MPGILGQAVCGSVRVGTAPRAVLRAKVQPACGLCKGANVGCILGWQVAARGGRRRDDFHSKGDRKPDRMLRSFFLKVSGGGHQGISPSGASRSAFGSRLRAPAADGRDLKISHPSQSSGPRLPFELRPLSPLSTGPRASLSPATPSRHLCTFAQELGSDLHLGTVRSLLAISPHPTTHTRTG